jgi:hypothetical protein
MFVVVLVLHPHNSKTPITNAPTRLGFMMPTKLTQLVKPHKYTRRKRIALSLPALGCFGLPWKPRSGFLDSAPLPASLAGSRYSQDVVQGAQFWKRLPPSKLVIIVHYR